jgi:hypothetical protein
MRLKVLLFTRISIFTPFAAQNGALFHVDGQLLLNGNLLEIHVFCPE